jgi:protein TonB
MKPELAASFLAAVSLHALILFGFRLTTPARPLALSDEPSSVDVSLVAAAPETAPALAAPTPAEPAPTPEPAATPEPVPTPEPQPTPDTPTPPPAPTPSEDAMPAPQSTPAPEHPKTMPRRQEQKRPKVAAPHSGAGTAAALAGAASRGALSHGAANGPLSSHASYRSNPKPDYPAEARRMRQEGVVMVSVEVGADGRPSDVSLGRSSGFTLLDQAAVQAVRRWTFEPARAAGLPVSSRVEVPVRFSLSR